MKEIAGHLLKAYPSNVPGIIIPQKTGRIELNYWKNVTFGFYQS